MARVRNKPTPALLPSNVTLLRMLHAKRGSLKTYKQQYSFLSDLIRAENPHQVDEFHMAKGVENLKTRMRHMVTTHCKRVPQISGERKLDRLFERGPGILDHDYLDGLNQSLLKEFAKMDLDDAANQLDDKSTEAVPSQQASYEGTGDMVKSTIAANADGSRELEHAAENRKRPALVGSASRAEQRILKRFKLLPPKSTKSFEASRAPPQIPRAESVDSGSNLPKQDGVQPLAQPSPPRHESSRNLEANLTSKLATASEINSNTVDRSSKLPKEPFLSEVQLDRDYVENGMDRIRKTVTIAAVQYCKHYSVDEKTPFQFGLDVDDYEKLDSLYRELLIGPLDWRDYLLHLCDCELESNMQQCIVLGALWGRVLTLKVFQRDMPWDAGQQLKKQLDPKTFEYFDRAAQDLNVDAERFLKLMNKHQIRDPSAVETDVMQTAHRLVNDMLLETAGMLKGLKKVKSHLPDKISGKLGEQQPWRISLTDAFKDAIIFKQMLAASVEGPYTFTWMKAGATLDDAVCQISDRVEQSNEVQKSQPLKVFLSLFPGIVRVTRNGKERICRAVVVAANFSVGLGERHRLTLD